VDIWSEERLEAWARVNITKDTIPQLDWHQRQVAIWARKVLNFDEEDEAALKKAKLNSRFLDAVPSLDALIKLYGIAPVQLRGTPAFVRFYCTSYYIIVGRLSAPNYLSLSLHTETSFK
jgi:hypothetical protein